MPIALSFLIIPAGTLRFHRMAAPGSRPLSIKKREIQADKSQSFSDEPTLTE
jgi:hypothetical protein